MRHGTFIWLSLLCVVSFPVSAFSQQPGSTFSLASDTEPPAPVSHGDHDNVVSDHSGMAGEHDGMDGEHHGHRVDHHAPAFLMGTHVHEAGEWMIGYRYSNMYMHGNQMGTTPLTNQQVLNTFMMVPTDMTMEMHMLPIMRGVTDDVTVYLMPMWMSNTMDMLTRTGMTMRSNNQGFSDLPFGALWRIWQGQNDELILNIGFSAPTGDIHNLNSMSMGMGMPMTTPFPYTMRLGHGTWDARPGVTYRYEWDRASLGVQGTFDLPMGMNDAHYQVGDEYRATAWLAYLLDAKKALAATFRVEGLWRCNYVGADPQLNPMMMSGNDPNMRGGEFLNLGFGLMYRLPKHLGVLEGEYVQPVSQNVRGVQATTDGAFAIRWVKMF